MPFPRPLRFTLLAALLGLGGWSAFRYWPRRAEPNLGTFQTLEGPGPAAALFPPRPGLESRLERVLPFRVGKRDYAVGVFASYDLDEGDAQHPAARQNSHASAPMLGIGLFERTARGPWLCLDLRREFCRHGAWGAMQEVSLVQVGPERPALLLSGGYTNMGVTTTQSAYHLLLTPDRRLDLKALLTLWELYDDSGGQEEAQKATSVEATTRILPQAQDGWYPIQIHHAGRAQGRAIAETATFRYSPPQGTYQLVPGPPLEGWWKGFKAQ